MEPLISLFKDIGTLSLDAFWLPVGIWTFLALLVAGFMKFFEDKISAVYHYHSRVALLWGLVAGVTGSALLYYLPLGTSAGTAIQAKFIVIQNPIPVTGSVSSASVNWAEPAVWIGLFTAAILLLAATALVKLFIDFRLLKSFSKNLSLSNSNLTAKLTDANVRLLAAHKNKVRVIFSNEVAVPCTFGWLCKRIVLPDHLRDNRENLNMALRHEFAHIKNSDFLINTSVKTIKALFLFHPLVHKITADIDEYREITCDQHVLQDSGISRKSYARLLLELSPKSVFKTSAAVNMAVQPSTLKKRIQTMNNSTHKIPSLKWSLSIMLIFSLIITGLMSCSDIEENGITGSEVDEMQANINETPSDGLSANLGDSKPLFVINEEMIDQKNIIGKLRPKYIESIDVLKGQNAIDEYGESGKNGVINITLFDKEKAFNDLRTEEEIKALQDKPNKPTKPGNDFYVKVENPPEIKGGLQSVMKNVEYPKQCRQAGIEGRVTVQFIVNEQGQAEDPQIIRGIGGGCDEEALRVVKQAEFEPGTQGGQPVRVQMYIPIVFKLNS